MQFTVTSTERLLTRDERAYIEFSVFSALRPFTDQVQHVEVSVSGPGRSGETDFITCAVHAGTADGPITARGSSFRLYGAVDSAAKRLAVAAADALGDSHVNGSARSLSRRRRSDTERAGARHRGS